MAVQFGDVGICRNGFKAVCTAVRRGPDDFRSYRTIEAVYWIDENGESFTTDEHGRLYREEQHDQDIVCQVARSEVKPRPELHWRKCDKNPSAITAYCLNSKDQLGSYRIFPHVSPSGSLSWVLHGESMEHTFDDDKLNAAKQHAQNWHDRAWASKYMEFAKEEAAQ